MNLKKFILLTSLYWIQEDKEMDYTAFGEWFRVERIKKHERLYDMEGVLGVSSSFISAVELGKNKAFGKLSKSLFKKGK